MIAEGHRLKEKFGRVNAEWRELTRQAKHDQSRLGELREERLFLMTKIFRLCRQPRRSMKSRP